MSYPSISSLPHQKAVIDHLVASCPKQRGLVVAHQMGAGKTLTALMMLRNYPKSKHIIVCPSFLKYVYNRESVNIFGKPLKKGTILLDYDEFKTMAFNDGEMFKNAILIMDEAHYLASIFENLDVDQFETLFGVLLSEPKKCLLMTGTPVYNSSNDLRLIVNIAAGKEVLPFRETDFMREFTVPRKFRAAFWGHFMPMVNTIVGFGSFIPSMILTRKIARDEDILSAMKTAGLQTYAISLVSLSLALITLIFSQAKGPMFFRKYDYEKIKQKIGPYVSFFKLKNGTLGVPLTKQINIHVLYDMHQSKMLTRMCYNELSDDDVKELGISKKHAKQAAFTGTYSKTMDMSKYLDVGRMVSNTSEVGTYPPKFEKCFENIVSHDQGVQFAVVYCDFQAAHDKFMGFLEWKKDTGKSFTFSNITVQHSSEEKSKILNDFKEGKIDILVLGVGMYEGVSILRASQFHILDPPKNYKDVTQLYGRVVRIHSHESLPKERQTVTYYNYVGILDTDMVDLSAVEKLNLLPAAKLNKGAQYAEMMRLYKQSLSYKYINFGLYHAPITAGVTAEYIAFSQQEPLRELMTEMEKLLQGSAVLPKMQCCPKYETDGISQECLLAQITNACIQGDD